MAKRGPRKTTPRSDVALVAETARALHVAALQAFLALPDDDKRNAIAHATGDVDLIERVMKLTHHPEMLAG